MFSSMDTQEAASILEEELQFFKQWPYPYLADLVGSQEVREVVSDTGKHYQLEIEFLWDDKPQGHIRVVGAIDDGGWRAFFPLCRSFIMKPDGNLIGD